MLGYGNNAGSSNNHTSMVKPVKLGRRMNDKRSLQLFRNVIFVLDDLLPQGIKSNLRNILQNNGGVEGDPSFDPTETSDSQRLAESKVPNLYISRNRLYPYECSREVVSVTPLWVDKAMTHGFVHDPSFYSPVLKQSLSGVVLLLLDFPVENEECILNEIKRFGGQHRNEITDDITHLVCSDPRGTYYNQCIERDIPIVLPQWLDDCFRFRKKMDEDLYHLTEPVVYYQHNPTPAKLFQNFDKEALSNPNADFNMVFEDHVIYFGQGVRFKEGFKDILVDAIVRAGGSVVDTYDYQLVTIVILKYRSTRECRMASKDQKLIASLWWLTNTLLRGYHTSSLSALLDYPSPPGKLPGMENISISISGYGNEKRSYLRRLATALGAQFDPSISVSTTHFICGRTVSRKYAQAQNIPNITIINHLWLEECYQQWKLLDCAADDRYTFIPEENPILSASAGHTHLLVEELARWMDPATIPEYTEAHYHIQEVDDQGNDENGQEQHQEQQQGRKRRRAAVQAIRVLNTIVMPDLNAYERESKQKR